MLALGVPTVALCDDSAAQRGTESDAESAKSRDDTPIVETEATVDGLERVQRAAQAAISGLAIRFGGDLRTIYEYFNVQARDGRTSSNDALGMRLRMGAEWGVTESLNFGARVAGTCFVDDCAPEFVMQRAAPGPAGLERGQFTFDQLYVGWATSERLSIAVGRLQTRFVLRSGVFAKSLDRNNSNNVNVNWTDGLQATYHAANGWTSSLVVEQNAPGGSGSIRRFPLDFDHLGARNTLFVGFENLQNWGPIVQRAFDISYLPSSLLQDGGPAGRRVDYWGLVGRLAARWPLGSKGMRLRGGLEVGYAPVTPSAAVRNLTGETNGLAWDVVVSLMDFRPGHSIGVNYAHTGAGWLLSPQFAPNDELFEIRYLWQAPKLPLLEARVRWREELEQPIGGLQRGEVFDLYVRLTWQF
jgi:hypothetical protein